jgi:hypothetical protein
MDKIYWYFLSSNPNAIHILEQNINKIDWNKFSANPNALHILSQPHNSHKIDWKNLSQNSGLFELDYIAMSRQRTNIIAQELMTKALHPSRVSKWLDYHLKNGYDITDFEY